MPWLFGSSRSKRAGSSAARRSPDRDGDTLSHVRTRPETGKTREAKEMPRHVGRSQSDGNVHAKRPSRKHDEGRHVSEEHAECSVCFEALCDAPTAVFVSNASARGVGWRRATRRTCSHFFHLECARSLCARSLRRCPVCRAPFDDFFPVPDPARDPRGWFAVVDANGDGKLSPSEIVEVLRAQIKCDWRAVEEKVTRRKSNGAKSLFDEWDPDGDGFVELREMVSPGGLLEYVTSTFPKTRDGSGTPVSALETSNERDERAGGSGSGSGSGSVRFRSDSDRPALASNPDAWFQYWDEDCSGSLDKEEVTRALVEMLRRDRERRDRERRDRERANDGIGRERPRGHSSARSEDAYGRNSYGRLLTDVAAAREVRNVVSAIWPLFCDAGAGEVVDRRAFLRPDGLAEAIVANASPDRRFREKEEKTTDVWSKSSKPDTVAKRAESGVDSSTKPKRHARRL